MPQIWAAAAVAAAAQYQNEMKVYGVVKRQSLTFPVLPQYVRRYVYGPNLGRARELFA